MLFRFNIMDDSGTQICESQVVQQWNNVYFPSDSHLFSEMMQWHFRQISWALLTFPSHKIRKTKDTIGEMKHGLTYFTDKRIQSVLYQLNYLTELTSMFLPNIGNIKVTNLNSKLNLIN